MSLGMLCFGEKTPTYKRKKISLGGKSAFYLNNCAKVFNL